MKVPLTIVDHLRRAELVYGNRTAITDEPDQPATSWGSLTYNQVAQRARAQAAGLDALGIPQGARVAMVSHNSARLFASFFGVSGFGRVLVPVNFRLVAEEVQYNCSPKRRATDAPQLMGECGNFWLATWCERSRHLLAHTSAISLQRLGHGLCGDGDGWRARYFAQSRWCRNSAAHRPIWHHHVVWCTCSSKHDS